MPSTEQQWWEGIGTCPRDLHPTKRNLVRRAYQFLLRGVDFNGGFYGGTESMVAICRGAKLLIPIIYSSPK